MTNILVLYLEILLVLLALSMPTLGVFLSIDCGSSDSFTDANNITWVGDDLYIKSGKSETVTSVNNSSIIARPYTTRRVFPTTKKNCYSIGVGRGEHVLLRAHFYYVTNKDEKLSAPVFDLQFDGNPWAIVENISADPFYKEVIYLTKFDAISVCVARNQDYPDDVPFISAIEVRSLDLGLYAGVDPNYPLLGIRRINYGGNESVRFPDDKYDRIWQELPSSKDFITVKNDTRIVVADLPDKPPESVLQTALYNQNLSGSLLCIKFPNLTNDKIYTIFYFSELLNLTSSDKRSFSIYVNRKYISHPIIPPYKTALGLNFTTDISAFGDGNYQYCLNRTSDSTLPPIINALEAFQIGIPLTDGTDNRHVKALSTLQKAFVQLQDWSGDPCLPNGSPWDWVECTYTQTPQITALRLSGYELQGSLPDFSALDTLQLIDLSNNSLSGEIPSFLGNFHKLNMLNLANNSFSGLIPSSLTNNSNLTLVYSGNPYLCASTQLPCVNSGNGSSALSPFSNSHSQSRISKNFLIVYEIVILVLVFVCY
ncbi:PREDICTED: putative leucine-rich repeat receptor-like protein kinase At2g19210 [Nelumbo nucifera]|uniref:Leucine-rich repeat receptor-like protein kinase At2g19210 n=1 Tax=Nelumbo nucifera TaxID=4432 RepID=A0A1U8BAC9_NELNU|nr:PREDICTED: putative leucine-rich repeat receptor-like protein kinase At2g19210 [Nelumbo nucifera]